MDMAVSHYKQAIELDKYFVEGYTDLAIILEVTGCYE